MFLANTTAPAAAPRVPTTGGSAYNLPDIIPPVDDSDGNPVQSPQQGPSGTQASTQPLTEDRAVSRNGGLPAVEWLADEQADLLVQPLQDSGRMSLEPLAAAAGMLLFLADSWSPVAEDFDARKRRRPSHGV